MPKGKKTGSGAKKKPYLSEAEKKDFKKRAEMKDFPDDDGNAFRPLLSLKHAIREELSLFVIHFVNIPSVVWSVCASFIIHTNQRVIFR